MSSERELYLAKWIVANAGFDRDFYLAQNPDVREHGVDPALHYVQAGALEGRDPNPDFSSRKYLEHYPEVARSGLNPLVHYFTAGRLAGAVAFPSQPVVEPEQGASGAPAYSCLRFSNTGPGVEPVAETIVVSEFLLQHDATPNGQPFGYTARGRDPQLLIQTGFPRGFCRFQIHIAYSATKAPKGSAHLLQLFMGDDDGFREANSWRYRICEGEVYIDDIIYNPKDVHSIRFDPMDIPGQFRIKTFQLTPLSLLIGAEALFAKFRHQEGSGEPESDLAPRGSVFDAVWDRFARAVSSSLGHDADAYQYWIEARRIDASVRAFFDERRKALRSCPVISILMPTYKSDLRFLERAVDSVAKQTYPFWELCIVDDGSTSPPLTNFLKALARGESRAKLKLGRNNQGIAGASNAALALASGTFIALLDHDDELEHHALDALAIYLDRFPTADMIYSDEDKISENGVRSGPMFKPDWSPEFMFSCMYNCHLSAYRTDLVRAVGGFRSEFDFAQDYDLAFRISAKAREIVHIPDVLYHWRTAMNSTASGADAKPTAELAARRAVQAALDAKQLHGRVVEGPLRGTHRLDLDLPGSPLVSIVIPTAARRIGRDTEQWYLLDLLESIRSKSTYNTIEIVVVHNGDIEPLLAERLEAFQLRLIHYRAKTFNISDKMNLGVRHANGEYVILLNDDMAIITERWIEEMLMWFSDPGIAGVGAKLLFPGGLIQHCGVLLLAQGPSHPYYGSPTDEPGFLGSAVLARNYSAVTGACLMVRKATYEAAGGFDPKFRINYNDVDFCMRLRNYGRIVQTPYAQLYHYESVSKDVPPASELKRFNLRWADIVGSDPYYNRNLSQTSATMDVAEVPRKIVDDYA